MSASALEGETKMMNGHVATAERIAEEIGAGRAPAVSALESARQGDLILTRIGGAGDGPCPPVPVGGLLLAAGSHGEHRLMANAALLIDDVLTVPDGGVVVHTDDPTSRHTALRLRSGKWRVSGQRELGLEEVIVQVQD